MKIKLPVRFPELLSQSILLPGNVVQTHDYKQELNYFEDEVLFSSKHLKIHLFGFSVTLWH